MQLAVAASAPWNVAALTPEGLLLHKAQPLSAALGWAGRHRTAYAGCCSGYFALELASGCAL